MLVFLSAPPHPNLSSELMLIAGLLTLVGAALFSLYSSSNVLAKEGVAQVERREAIRQAFQYNYAKYEEFAYPNDLLRPISKTGQDNEVLVGFGGTVIDSMSTMLVMGMADSPEYRRALHHAKSINFNHTNHGLGKVSIFELTIRYLGGLISAYQLGGEKPEEKFLIDQAATLANRLSWGWIGNNRVPFNEVKYNDGEDINNRVVREANCIAGAGTLTMEWGMLSNLTGNATYRELAEGSVNEITNSKPVFPGLWAMQIWPDDATARGDYVTWGAGSDSFFEYLIKYPFLLGDSEHSYLDVYRQTLNSTIQHLLKQTGVGNLTFLADYSKSAGDNGTIYIHSHLACFSGGNIAMAGRLLEKDEWVEIGLQLAESCAMTYQRSVSGVGPVAFGWFDENAKAKGWEFVSPARRRFYNKNGFFITHPSWNHMPEIMESVFYAYRITGQEFWRDFAWEAFLSIKKACDTGNGWVGIRNVNDPSSGSYDETQTFLFAELLKYLYLIFDDPERFSLDDYVFNTEAHPIQKRASGKDFGKIQGTNHPYNRIASSKRDKQVSTNPHFNDLPTITNQANHQEQVLAAEFQLPTRTAASSPQCQAKGFIQIVHCHSYTLVLLPFGMLIAYRLSLLLLGALQRAERGLYRQAQALGRHYII